MILISARIMAPLEPAVAKAGFITGRAWDLADADRPRVRALLHAGEARLTPDFLESLPNLGLIMAVETDRTRSFIKAAVEIAHDKTCRGRGENRSMIVSPQATGTMPRQQWLSRMRSAQTVRRSSDAVLASIESILEKLALKSWRISDANHCRTRSPCERVENALRAGALSMGECAKRTKFRVRWLRAMSAWLARWPSVRFRTASSPSR